MEKSQYNYTRDGIFIVSLILIALVLEFSSGTDGVVTMHSVPKEKNAAPLTPTKAANNPVKATDLINFKSPAGWIEDENPSPMTTFSFNVPGGAIVSAIPLPARIADNPMIVNMWRGQVGLDPIDSTKAGQLAKAVNIGGNEGSLYDFSGTQPIQGQSKPPRLIMASLKLGQVAWFLKMAGPAESIENQLASFTQFLAELKFQPAAYEINFDKLMQEAQQSAPTPDKLMQEAQQSAPTPTWTIPKSWEEKPATQMRLGNFSAGNGKAEITVMTFPGTVGGLLANVNRWREQSGLAAVSDSELNKVIQQITISGKPATLAEAIGEKNSSLSVYHPVDQQTWFYKMSGPSEVIKAEKAAFTSFLQSIEFK